MEGKKKNLQGGSERARSISNTAKGGAVAFAFMALGFQLALFVHRAAVMRIVANRDKPDTVYVYVPAKGSATVKRSAATGTPEAVRVYRSRPERKVESFRFNPNTVSVEDLIRLGFSEKQARSIDTYRSRGGRFRRKSDFAGSYVVSDSVYRRLESFIDIPLLDINKADSAEFDALPGIGGYYAKKMVEYRIELGGYSSPSQLLDIYRFGEDRFDGLKDLITCSPPRPFALWTLPVEELRKHPYIRNYRLARSIVLYRENNPREMWTVDGLEAAGVITEEQAAKLRLCVIE